VIDQDDYGVWKSHYGQSSPGGASQLVIVPASLSAPLQRSAANADAAATAEKPVAPATQPVVALPVIVATAEFRATAAPTVIRPASSQASPAARHVEPATLVRSQVARQVKTRVAADSRTPSAESSDAAILAWLTTASHAVRRSAAEIHTNAGGDTAEVDESCDSLDVVFEALGVA
jgi:hypothetical protein